MKEVATLISGMIAVIGICLLTLYFLIEVI